MIASSLAATLGPKLSRELAEPVHCGTPGQRFMVGGLGTKFLRIADSLTNPTTIATYSITLTDHHGSARYLRVAE